MNLFFNLILRLRNTSSFLLGMLLLLSGCTHKTRLLSHIKRGDDYFSAQQYNKAKIEYLNAFRLNPSDPHVLNRLSETLLHEGEAGVASQLLTKLCQLQPTNHTAAVTLGSIYFLAGETPKAAEWAEAALKISPSNTDALILIANCANSAAEISAAKKRIESQQLGSSTNAPLFFALGLLAQKSQDPSQAETLFQKAVTLDSSQSKYHLALANISWIQAKTNNADAEFKAALQLAPAGSIERLRYADFLLKTRRAGDAKAVLNEALNSSPNFLAGLNLLSEIALSETEFDTALSFNSKVLSQDAKNRDALLNRARIKLAKRDSDSALAELQELGQKYTRDPGVQFYLAVAQLAKNDSAKALLSLDRAISLSTNFVDAIILRSEIQISNADFGAAIPELNRLIRVFPDLVRAHYLLASAYRLRGTPDDALAVYSNLAKANPSDPQPVHSMAVVFRQQNKISQAREAYERALKINPDFLASIDALVELDLLDKKPDAAFSRVQLYVDKYPDKPLPYLLQAKIFASQSKHDEAISRLEKAISLDPEFYLGHRLLAQLYTTTGKRDQAITKLRNLIAKDQKDVGAMLQLAMLLESGGDYTEARKNYESLLKASPGSVVALNNLAYLLSERLGQGEQALTYAQRARDLAPYDPFSADTFGWITLKKGDYSHALSVLQQAAERLPDEPEVLFHVGMAYYFNGTETQARNNLEAAIRSKKEFSGKDQASKALAVLDQPVTTTDPSSIQFLEKSISQNSNDLFAWIRLGQIYENQRNFDKARESYNAALKINRRSAALLTRVAQLHAFSLQDPQAGLDFAKEAWSLSQNPAIAAILGRIGYEAGDYSWAYALLLEAKRLQPENANNSYYLGFCSYALARPSEAQKYLQESLQLKFNSPEAEKARACLDVISLEVHPGTQKTVSSALQKIPDFTLTSIASGLIAEAKSDFATAKQSYEAVLKRFPRHLAAQKRLALLLTDKFPDDARADQMLKSLRTELPRDPQLTKAMGKLAYRRGDNKEVVRLLKDQSLSPDDSEVLYYLGMAQYHLKDKQARESLKRALALDSSSQFSAEAKRAVAELN
jgi:tetratricopeptide (TPR) repeat protein